MKRMNPPAQDRRVQRVDKIGTLYRGHPMPPIYAHKIFDFMRDTPGFAPGGAGQGVFPARVSPEKQI
jgi:hypothetical protein